MLVYQHQLMYKLSDAIKSDNYKLALVLREKIALVRGAVDVTLLQVPDQPQLNVDVDRSKALQFGLTQHDVANSLLISLSSSFQTAQNYWVNPLNGVNYNLAVQTPDLSD